METKFSDRAGFTVPLVTIQVEGMNDRLKNALWNYLLKTILTDFDVQSHPKVTQCLCENHFRLPLDNLPQPYYQHKDWLRAIYFNKQFPWYEIYNLMEFIANNCGSMKYGMDPNDFKNGMNNILIAELSGYRFIAGVLTPISNKEEMESISKGIMMAHEKGLSGTKKHIETALALISKKPLPDYRNSIKESISALESLVKQIAGEEGGGLEKALSILNERIHFHGAFKSGLLSLYGFTSDANGIRHAILEEPDLGLEDATFMLVACSAIINFLISKADKVGLLKK